MNPSNIPDVSQLSDDQFLNWGASNGMASYSDPSASYNSNVYSSGMGGQVQQSGGMQFAPVSNQLVRRNGNQQLARGPVQDVTRQGIWSSLGDGGQPEWEHIEDDEELEQKAAAAKREAQAKRPPKQIPPFIQKLSSFLDESNTDLIKWSEDGSSFIVLDEDEFAKKLIPELFKHNNYASFVRQLNMYGFHKKVGLSDNSMRASEKKAKSPSEYYNPYFKRGRPELLWLIQKPKNETASNKRKRGKHSDQDQGSDDETKREGDHDSSNIPDDGGQQRQQRQQNDLITLPRPEYAALRQEVMALQRSQKQIAQVLSRMRDENQQYYQQAKAFQAQSERQENSINAILTFLATFYNRSLEGHGNVGAMFSHVIPGSQPQGNVVDVGEYDAQNTPRPRPARRPLALLPAPATTERTSPRLSATTSSASPKAWANEQRRQNPLRGQQYGSDKGGQVQSTNSSAHSSPTPDIKASPSSPIGTKISDTDTANNNSAMMSVIHNVNANSKPASDSKLDFNAALRHYENASGQGPLTPEQRDNILSVMGSTVGLNNTSNGTNSTSMQPANSNALISPTPPLMPSLDPLHSTREQLDQLHRQMKEQDSKVQELASRLQPLSPSGSIPGLPPAYYGNGPGGDPGNFNLNASDDFDVGPYLNSDYFPDYDALGGADFGTDMNFDLDDNQAGGADALHTADDDIGDTDYFGHAAAGDGLLEPEQRAGGGRVVGSVGTSSGVHSPANMATVDDDDDDDEEAGTDTPSKRRKLMG